MKLRSRLIGVACAAAALLSGAGCDDEGPNNALPDQGAVSDGGGLPNLPPGWNEIMPGGDTICARGTPYSFFVNPGTSNRLVIDFQGGGACWTKETCGLAGSLFFDSIDVLRDIVKNGVPGMYKHDDVDNPLHDAWHVVIPYCTGDLHWGDAVVDYGDAKSPLVIRHKGAVNARAVLDWVYANFKAPESILVTGCSAGSYGSIMWAPTIKHRYESVPVVQFGDSGAGVITGTFFHDSFPKWKPEGSAPSFIPTLDPSKVDWSGLGLPDLYARIGAYYPSMTLSQFNDANDKTQILYYKAMGGTDGTEWSREMFESIDKIHSTTPNFRSYVGGADQHCVIPDDDYKTFESGGVKFVDWFKALQSGKDVENVECQNCRPAPLPDGGASDASP